MAAKRMLLKVTDLNIQLEERNVDYSGKKAELQQKLHYAEAVDNSQIFEKLGDNSIRLEGK